MLFQRLLPLFAECQIINQNEFAVSSICYDYRKITHNSIYVAIDIFNYKGKERDGHEFIKDAVTRGARAIIVKKKQSIPLSVCQIVTQNPRRILEKLAARFYSYPAKKLFTVGVTGTKGKTTTVYLINHFLGHGGFRTGLISTAEFKIGSRFIPNYTDVVNETHLTCPESLELQKSLRQMLVKKTDVAVIEATSHSLKLCRAAYECQYDIGVITNLQSEHLDFHKTIKDYYESKAKLFKLLDRSYNKGLQKVGIINADDYAFKYLKKVTNSKIFTYGIYKKADFWAKQIEIKDGKTHFTLNGYKFITSLLGEYNIYNILAAIGVGRHFGVSFQKLSSALKNFSGVPGRMQEVKNNSGIKIFVDYAHTPESLSACLKTLKKFCNKRLIVVFGCGGDRDPRKRPEMGKIATLLADYSIITSEDPRSERPSDIIGEITSGAVNNNYVVNEDRKKAIARALRMARRGDFIVITGKGDEKHFEINGKQLSWNDAAVIKELLRQRAN